MTNLPLLIELGTEELPPTALKVLSTNFAKNISDALLEAKLIDQESASQHTVYASPRRLAVLIHNVADEQETQSIEKRGPAVAAAFDEDGNPTPAAQGFARSCGTEVDKLQRLKSDKGEWLSYSVSQPGKTLAELLDEILLAAVKQLPIPKRMRWGDGDAEFVRPAHWLLALHGEAIVDCSVLALRSGRTTKGHRFHGEATIEITDALSYATQLQEQGHVIASFESRQEQIAQQLNQLAASIDANLESDQELLDEVTALVEWPNALLGHFDASFLEVPPECLISSMRDHQKYFHLRDAQGNLLANFITVSNIRSKDPDRVTAGNERVLKARLSDAQFFWESDKKQSLQALASKLDDVLFHAKLGSLDDKQSRLRTLAGDIAKQISADEAITQRSAELAKADLVSDMVGEFDKLQGVMGHYYADLGGEPALVGECIEQHYWPRYAGDNLPASPEAQALALADRVDSLVGIYAAGEVPTGDKDPYSLRRAALGILRILIEKELAIDLTDLIAKSASLFEGLNIDTNQDILAEIVSFVQSRLPAYYQAQDISLQAINSVAACSPTNPLEFDQRLAAVRSFNEMDEAADLAAANKRINNILKKQTLQAGAVVDVQKLEDGAEKVLYEALIDAEKTAGLHFAEGDYTAGLKSLASLRTPVDGFFEDVMVMSDDESLRNNRLAILKQLQALFWQVADISQLQN